eukprot:GFYU01009596.1.p1 GENE.GFYU01009596.1~~GFYU01009596.1.p1  ORF type:complete len:290 (+),score=38.27 GFYU01009596.1:114-872(+)
MLNKLFGEDSISTTEPTIGFMIEGVTFRNVSFSTWDVGGRDKVRPLWKYFYQRVHDGNIALVYVLDCADDSWRLGESIKELALCIEAMEEVVEHKFPILVFANKVDVPNGIHPDLLEHRLKQGPLAGRDHRTFHFQVSVATEGKGICEGFSWLSHHFSRERKVDKASKSLRELCHVHEDWWKEAFFVSRTLVGAAKEEVEQAEAENLSTAVVDGEIEAGGQMPISAKNEKILNELSREEVKKTELAMPPQTA